MNADQRRFHEWAMRHLPMRTVWGRYPDEREAVLSKGVKVPKEIREKVIERLKAGDKGVVVSRELGISVSAVSKIRREVGLGWGQV